jgi:hypothetical protein
LQGNIVQRRHLHGNEEEGKEEETLTVSETIPRTSGEFHTGLSREAPPERPLLCALLVVLAVTVPVVQALREIVRFFLPPVSQ